MTFLSLLRHPLTIGHFWLAYRAHEEEVRMARRSIETDPRAFLTSIERWDGQSPAFEDVVLNGITLSILYGGASILLVAIANACRVQFHEVRDWANGATLPSSGQQAYVVSAIHGAFGEHYRVFVRRYGEQSLPVSHVRRVSRPIAAVSNE